MRFLEYLLKAVRDAAVHNHEVQVAPACILWPDRDRQWEVVVPGLRAELPELFVLGGYDPEKHTGPAIWLRCVIAGRIAGLEIPRELTPILYLPGVSRQDLRDVRNCPDHLKPLAELQFRGVIWSQISAKDWTILSLLKSDQGGLGLDVAMDNATKNAMQLAVNRLLDEDVDLLRGKRLDKDYFNTLLSGGDLVKDLLLWLDQGEAFRENKGANEWRAFVEVSKSQLAFDPEKEGLLTGAQKLAEHEGPWRPVWDRFCEAPRRYPGLPTRIRQCRAPDDTIFWQTDAERYEGWPQWNDDQEKSLRSELSGLANYPAHQARDKIIELEKRHCVRRKMVWAELGHSPLAMALKYLAVLSRTTANTLAAGKPDDLVAGYKTWGWQADDALVRSMTTISKPEDLQAVTTALQAIYRPWAEDSARYLQQLMVGQEYPGGNVSSPSQEDYREGSCVIFVDGLRFDMARRLTEWLNEKGLKVEETPVWAALPSVTSTGKPAVSPVRKKITGEEANSDFEPMVAQTGQSLKGGYHLKKLLVASGWEVLERTDLGHGQGRAWYEFGDIDHEGHDRGWKLAKQADGLINEIGEQILHMLSLGWAEINIVTDHGWLLLPGGLPKVDLPAALTDSKWGRCAVLKDGAATDEHLYPWYWNPNRYFALADGISCFRSGEEYAHGGLSLQECLTLKLVVTSGKPTGLQAEVDINDVQWKGMRCLVSLAGQFTGFSVDIRLEPGHTKSSLLLGREAKAVREDGQVSVVVERDEFEGKDATVVLLGPDSEPVKQVPTKIGGDKQ